MSSPLCFKLYPWTIVSLDQCLLGQKSSRTNVPWTKWSLDNCPLDKVVFGQLSLGQMYQHLVGGLVSYQNSLKLKKEQSF